MRTRRASLCRRPRQPTATRGRKAMATWAEVTLPALRERGEAVSAGMMELGAVGLQEDHLPGEAPPPRQPWDTGPAPPPTPMILLRAWWPGQDFSRRWPVLAAALERLAGAAPTWRVVQDEDWAESWRAVFERVVVSPGVAVAPPWKAEPGDLIIDPGMAFGTGEHATTRACLALVERLGRPGETCLDVGTGSGVVALLAARLGMVARGIDIDADAIAAARENALRNGLEAQFDDTPLDRLHGSWDLVVANIFAEVLVVLAPHLARVCAGRIVLAGILADRVQSVERALAAQGVAVDERRIEGEWVCLVLSQGAP